MPTRNMGYSMIDAEVASSALHGVLREMSDIHPWVDKRIDLKLHTLTKQGKLNPDNIEKVIFNPPATIVMFTDGTKSVVKCGVEDTYCPEQGFAQAMMNVMFDSRSGFKKFIKEKGVFPDNIKK